MGIRGCAAMRNALGFVLDFTAVFVAMGALAGTTLGAIAFALLFGEAAPFYQCMDPSSLGPATTSSDRGNGTGDSDDDSKQPRPAPRLHGTRPRPKRSGIHRSTLMCRHVNLHYAAHLRTPSPSRIAMQKAPLPQAGAP